MNSFKPKRVWLPLCALLLIGCAIILPVVVLPNGSLFQNSVKSVDASISTDSFGIATSPNEIWVDPGGMDLYVPNLFDPLGSCLTPRNTLQNLPLVSTNQRFSCLPVSDSPIVIKSNGDHGTRKEMLMILLIFIASLILLCMLCLVIIARRFLLMMKYVTLKFCYPNLSDPSKRFLAGRPIQNRSPMRKIEQSCSRLLFGQGRASL